LSPWALCPGLFGFALAVQAVWLLVVAPQKAPRFLRPTPSPPFIPSVFPLPTSSCGELPIILATMDLIKCFVLLLNRLPRDHRFALGGRRYATAKLERLEPLNARLDLLRLQIRLLHGFQLIDERRYEHMDCLEEDGGR
jgi:hypothetical protein